MSIDKKHAGKCITHHYACDCREYKAQEMESALKTIRTWAKTDADDLPYKSKVLVPNDVIKLCDKALGVK